MFSKTEIYRTPSIPSTLSPFRDDDETPLLEFATSDTPFSTRSQLSHSHTPSPMPFRILFTHVTACVGAYRCRLLPIVNYALEYLFFST